MSLTSAYISSVQLLSCVWLFVSPWTVTHQASLSITNSRGLLKLMSIESYRKNYFCFFCLKRQLGIISIFKSSPSVLSCVQVQMLVTQWCWILCNPIDCSPPGSSVHGILQARILEWVAISFCSWSSQSRNRTQVSSLAGRFYTLPK